MELETPDGSPETNGTTLGREIYITPEQLALASIVDAIDKRVLERLKEEEDEWTEQS